MKKLCIALLSMFTLGTFAQIEVVSNGNVGIGTTGTPNDKLEVVGNIRASGGVNASSLFTSGTLIANQVFSNNLLGNKQNGMGQNMELGNANYTTLSFSADRYRLYATATNTEVLSVLENGNIGIGRVNPISTLDVNGRITFNGNNENQLYLADPAPSNGAATNTTVLRGRQVDVFASDNVVLRSGLGTNDKISFMTNGSEKMLINHDGNVGIGTDDTFGRKLAVNGNGAFRNEVDASEFRVYTNGSEVIGDAGASPAWPDYVFEDDYNLLPLKEVEKHIEEKGHLPNIPSAKEVEEKGHFSLGVMNKKLLEKVEELTLYLIDQNKKLEKQGELIRKLEKQEERLKKLEKELSELKNK